MSDEQPRKAWARCPACSTVYPNIQIAKDGHKLNCPHAMMMRIQKLEEKVEALGGNISDIASAEPEVDFDGVEDDVEDDHDEAVQTSAYAGEAVNRTVAVDDEWDDEDTDSVVTAVR